MDEAEQDALDVAQLDLTQPSVARMYDYSLGGAHNFAVDREAAEEVQRVYPGVDDWSRANPAFLRRAVRTLIHDYGIDQFLDLGSGIPTVGNVHEVAQRANPAARVAYVDTEPIAVQHARHLLAGDEQTTMTQADLCQPHSVLHAPGVAGLLDFTRPVAVLAVAIFDLLDNDPATLVAPYRQACTPGSALVVSHSAALGMSAQEWAEHAAVLQRAGMQLQARDRDAIAGLFTGYDLLDPGVVPTAAWRPENTPSQQQQSRSNAYAAVGVLP